jgi:hypothetical protein
LLPEFHIPEIKITTWQRVSGTLSTLFAWALGLAMVAGVVIAFLKGMDWIALSLYPWVLTITELTLLVGVPLCLPFMIARATRGYAGYGLVYISFIVSAYLWLYSLVMALALAGIGWMITGVLFAGLGVIGVAGIAALIQGQWMVLLTIVINIAIVVALRMFGSFLVERSDLE